MAGVLHNSEELTSKFSKYKIQETNIEVAEMSLKKVKTELESTVEGSKEYLDLKTKENGWIRRIAIEKKNLLNMGDYELMEKQLQSYAKTYDSLALLVKEKTLQMKP